MIFERVGEVCGVKTWGYNTGKYSFLIGFDVKLGVYSASWHLQEGKSYSQFIGERIHPETNLPYFASRGAAIRACEETLKQLTNKN